MLIHDSLIFKLPWNLTVNDESIEMLYVEKVNKK